MTDVTDLSEIIMRERPWLADRPLPLATFTKASQEPPSPADDAEIAERLIRAYRKAVADAPNSESHDMWSEITASYQSELVQLVASSDHAALITCLRELPRRSAGHGFFQGEVPFNLLAADAEERHTRALWLFDSVLGMAEAVGVLNVRCPEQVGFSQIAMDATIKELIAKIEDRTGLPIVLPPVFDGLFALESGVGPVHLRTVSASYAIWKASGFAEMLLDVKPETLSIGEIGAGIGYCAYAASKLGISRYTIYDLPETNIAQGYFLLSVLPRDSVSLYGESPSKTAATAVSVLPGFAYHQEDRTVDLMMNIDSMPEIATDIAVAYIKGMEKKTSLFYSINQEAQAPQRAEAAQSVVRDLVTRASSMQPLLRYPNWVRQGYVDEIWMNGATSGSKQAKKKSWFSR